jgi:UDP-N-acetylglucosamine 2-epimerase (non-hydrolysing)
MAPEILLVAGTRPEAIKLAPLVHALDRLGVPPRTLVLGQHPKAASEAFAEHGCRVDRCLAPVAHPLAPRELSAALREQARQVLAELPRVGWLVVHGDTIGAHAAALAARARGIQVAHVEAGLRSHQLRSPFPEEWLRRDLARLAQRHYAPTTLARRNLLAEGVPGATIRVTGNTGIDSLRRLLPPAAPASTRRTLLLALHRRENQGWRLRSALAACARMAGTHQLEVRCLLHPNPRVAGVQQDALACHPAIQALRPLSQRALLEHLQTARLFVTDSGGLQEEAPYLGLPTLVYRRATERPEGLASGHLQLSAPATLEADITALLHRAPRRPARFEPEAPYGDGHAAGRIAVDLLALIAVRRRQPA